MIFPQPGRVTGLASGEEPIIVPLAIPIIAGPSTIVALILLANQDHSPMMDWSMALGAAWLETVTILMLSNTLPDCW